MTLNLSLDDEWMRFLSTQSQPAFAVSCGSLQMNQTQIQSQRTKVSTTTPVPESTNTTKCAATLFPVSSSTLFPKLKQLQCLEDTDNETFCEMAHVQQHTEEYEDETDINDCAGEPATEHALSQEINTLFISTKTKVLFLNQEIDINEIFGIFP